MSFRRIITKIMQLPPSLSRQQQKLQEIQRERNKKGARPHPLIKICFYLHSQFALRSRLGTLNFPLSLTSIRTSVDLFIISPGIFVADFRFFFVVTQFTLFYFTLFLHYNIFNSLLWICLLLVWSRRVKPVLLLALLLVDCRMNGMEQCLHRQTAAH